MTEEQLKQINDKIYALSKNIQTLNNDLRKLEVNINKEKKKHFFDGAIFFYGLVVGLIAGTLGNIFASLSIDLAKTDKNFNLISAFWISTGCLIAVIITFSVVSLYFWRKSRKA